MNPASRLARASAGAGGEMGVEGAVGERALIEAALAGDRGALETLWETHRRWVAAILLAHKPREAELEDLLQDVAQSLVGKLDQVRDAGSFVPWLRSVAISIARTKGRRATVRRRAWETLTAYFSSSGRVEMNDDESANDGGEESTPERERGRSLLELAGELAEGYREPLLMKCVQGMSYRQIGAAMGLPETTIETRIARARRMLRERAAAAGLDREDDDDEAVGVLMSAGAGRERMKSEVDHEGT